MYTLFNNNQASNRDVELYVQIHYWLKREAVCRVHCRLQYAKNLRDNESILHMVSLARPFIVQDRMTNCNCFQCYSVRLHMHLKSNVKNYIWEGLKLLKPGMIEIVQNLNQPLHVTSSDTKISSSKLLFLIHLFFANLTFKGVNVCVCVCVCK